MEKVLEQLKSTNREIAYQNDSGEFNEVIYLIDLVAEKLEEASDKKTNR